MNMRKKIKVGVLTPEMAVRLNPSVQVIALNTI